LDSGSAGKIESKHASEAPVSPAVEKKLQFFRVRNRVYTALLAFVVIAGLPVLGVPLLRHRLTERVETLRIAVAGGLTKSVTAKVGENQEPFPSEYEHPVAKPNYPQLPAYLNSVMKQSQPYDVGQVYPPKPSRKLKIPAGEPAAAETAPAQAAAPAQAEPSQETQSEDAQPVYRQGKMEQEVYDLLLKSDASLASLVQGSNPSYKLKSWDVAKRQEDLYWVRVTFTQMPAQTDMECIWQVQLMSKQVLPLNYNAKSLPR
jgi:hypothetical protein